MTEVRISETMSSMDTSSEIKPDLKISISHSEDQEDAQPNLIHSATASSANTSKPPLGPGSSPRRTYADVTSGSNATATTIRCVSPMNSVHSNSVGGGGGISRCSSIDSDNMDWAHISTVSSSDAEQEFNQPLSPSIMLSPNCVRNRSSMDGAVSSTMECVSQLHSFLSESSGVTSKHGSSRSNTMSIRRVGSRGEDSVGTQDYSVQSDDSLDREEARLNEAVEEMKRELECVDRLLVMSVRSPQPAPPHEQAEEDPDETDLNYSMESSTTPRKSIFKVDSFEYGLSPSGVTDLQDPIGYAIDRVSDGGDTVSSSSSPLGSVSKSLLTEFDAVTTSINKETSSRRLLHRNPTAQVAPTIGWIECLADLAFGRHEYKVSTTSKQVHTRTIEGGFCVASSVAVVLSILLRETNLVNVITERQFFAAMLVLPPLLTLLEVRLPHRIEETSLALGLLVGGMVLERTICL